MSDIRANLTRWATDLRRQTLADSRRAITLVDLLMVMTIIAIMLSLLLPAIQAVRYENKSL